jgi:carbon monoxide dehydrogenase subunit G
MSMEFEHSFTVPVPPDKAWDVLLDVEQVAPCMPGASVESVEGDDISGRMKVKVGPITQEYRGKAHFVERDAASHTVVLEASGKEARGSGTASATVRSTLQGEDGKTVVNVKTTLNVTGRPAQMGRGILEDVGGRLVTRFADNLASMLSATESGTGAAGTAGGQAPAAAGTGTATGAATTTPAGAASAQAQPSGDQSLNLIGVAAWPVIKRIGPAIAAAVVAAFIAIRARIRHRRSAA